MTPFALHIMKRHHHYFYYSHCIDRVSELTARRMNRPDPFHFIFLIDLAMEAGGTNSE